MIFMVDRINLHEEDESELHCMILSKVEGEDTPIMCHPEKDMVYMIIKGKMIIDMFDNDGNKIDALAFEPYRTGSERFIHLFEKNKYYRMRPVTDVVFVEVNRGPFVKETHNRYLNDK